MMLDQTVQATSTTLAASARLYPAGMGSSWPSGTVAYSLYPPPESRTATSSPGCQGEPSGRVAPLGSSITPAASRPMMFVVPRGGG